MMPPLLNKKTEQIKRTDAGGLKTGFMRSHLLFFRLKHTRFWDRILQEKVSERIGT